MTFPGLENAFSNSMTFHDRMNLVHKPTEKHMDVFSLILLKNKYLKTVFIPGYDSFSNTGLHERDTIRRNVNIIFQFL